MNDKTRYDVIPISEKTRKGMTLKIDDLGAIGRMLSLQDNAYDEQFDKLFKLMDSQQMAIMTILETLKELKTDVDELKNKVGSLETKIGEVSKEVKCTKDEMETLAQKVSKLERLNTIWSIAVRIGVGIVIALGLARWLHGPFI
jgi:chromosome segregation ATPase